MFYPSIQFWHWIFDTTFCFLMCQVARFPPTYVRHLEVECLLRRFQHNQHLKSQLYQYDHSSCISSSTPFQVAFRYLKKWYTTSQCARVGLSRDLLITQNWSDVCPCDSWVYQFPNKTMIPFDPVKGGLSLSSLVLGLREYHYVVLTICMFPQGYQLWDRYTDDPL